MKTIKTNETENFIHNKYGYCYYVVTDENAFIFNLYIEPIYRKCGHAKKLLKCVIREIRECGYIGEIEIEAIPRENSIEKEKLILFYKSIGLKLKNS